jgi:hypothetical protein
MTRAELKARIIQKLDSNSSGEDFATLLHEFIGTHELYDPDAQGQSNYEAMVIIFDEYNNTVVEVFRERRRH